MNILERVERHANLMGGLVRELEVERSYRGIERLVQLIIQALLDLCLMITVALDERRPRAYSEIGYILREYGVISDDEAKLLKSMAGLRKVLVHAYAVVDRDKVAEFAERLKVDAPRIVSIVLGGVKGKPIDPHNEDTTELAKKLRSVFSGRVLLAFLYGGRVKGYTLKGDYDIAVLMKPQCNLYMLGELVVDAAKALGVAEEDVDIVCIDMLPPEHVLEALSGIPIIVDDHAKLFELKYRAILQLLDLEEDMSRLNARS
ncbi:MAG: DUF86 domain-containing protein [archaeon YNP-WB-040]|nr:DUF86 domain-containing protein [Candidatus Culexarchaeum yellowstonense]